MTYNNSLIEFDKFNDNEDIRKQALQSAADGGPNSGFEIAGIDFFKNPALTNEFPEMKDDINLIISTEAYIHRLIDFDRRLRSYQGMSRGMAYELKELVPDLENFNPKAYTEDVSGVNVQPTLEAISAKLWVLIAAAAAFVIGIIYKFVGWLFGDSSGGAGADAKLEKAEEGIKQSDKMLEEQSRAAAVATRILRSQDGEHVELEIPSVVDHKAIENSNMPDALKREILEKTQNIVAVDPTTTPGKTLISIKLRDILADMEGGKEIYHYLRHPNKYARVIYGPRTETIQLIMASFDGFVEASSLIAGQLDMLTTALQHLEEDQLPKPGLPSHGLNSSLSLVEELKLTKNELKFGGRSYDSIMHWAMDLKQSIDEAATYEPNFNDLEELLSGYEVGLNRVKSASFRKVLTFIELLRNSQPVLQRLERMAKRMQAMRAVGDVSDRRVEEQGAQIMRVHKALTSNLVGLMRVYSEISRVYSEVTKHGAGIVDALRKNSGGILAFYRRFDEIPPPMLEELNEKLTAASEVFDENTIRPHMLPKEISISGVKVSFGLPGDEEPAGPDSVTLSVDEAWSILKKTEDK